jgi:hypothetical protein
MFLSFFPRLVLLLCLSSSRLSFLFCSFPLFPCCCLSILHRPHHNSHNRTYYWLWLLPLPLVMPVRVRTSCLSTLVNWRCVDMLCRTSCSVPSVASSVLCTHLRDALVSLAFLTSLVFLYVCMAGRVEFSSTLFLSVSLSLFRYLSFHTHKHPQYPQHTHTHYSHLYTLSGNVASHAIFDHGQQWCPEPWQQPRARGCCCSWQQEPC